MQSTAEVILQRKATDSTPSTRTDAAKVGLVIEGGGMRGVVSAGMVAALETLGLLNCFDVIYGSSAGAINGAYFLSGQARYGTTIYYQDISNFRFINFARALIGQPIVSLEFLLDRISEQVKPLDWEAVLNAKPSLTAVASSMTDERPIPLSSFATKDDLKECLRASARIPFLAGAPLPTRSKLLWDAMVYEDIPVRTAIDDGCTHIMALLTHPQGKAKYDLNFFDRHAMAAFIAGRSISAARTYLRQSHFYGPTVNNLVSGRISHRNRTAMTLAVQMDGSNNRISGLEIRPRVLRNGAVEGFKAVYRALGFGEPQIVEILAAF